MWRKSLVILPLFFFELVVLGQEKPVDSLPLKLATVDYILDSTSDFESVMKELEWFLDSIDAPHSYLMGSVGIGKGYYNFITKSNFTLEASGTPIYMPSVGYFHKSGFNISAMGNLIRYENNTNLYQFSVSPGYDYLVNKQWATGITFTRYFTRNDVPFYTTPLQNEVFAYFSYRPWWLKPTIAINYGWGSRSEYAERETLIQDLRLRRDGIIKINSKESISDFTINGSLKHDFYWLDIFSKNDHIRFTPQLDFDCGTQKFGFNQSSDTYATIRRTNADILYQTESIYLDDQIAFQPLTLDLFLRGEYSIGKFFVQAQVALDYYFPAIKNNFSSLFSMNMGFVF